MSHKHRVKEKVEADRNTSIEWVPWPTPLHAGKFHAIGFGAATGLLLGLMSLTGRAYYPPTYTLYAAIALQTAAFFGWCTVKALAEEYLMKVSADVIPSTYSSLYTAESSLYPHYYGMGLWPLYFAAANAGGVLLPFL